MKISELVLAGIAGTTAFTLFSYAVSEATGKKFKEPRLLGTMVDRSVEELDKKESQAVGWMLHYLTGVAFVAGYKLIIQSTGIKPNFKNGMIIGGLSGFPAALMWNASLRLHPAPPRKPSLDYYGHLFLGHVIFGAFSFLVLQKRLIKECDQQQ